MNLGTHDFDSMPALLERMDDYFKEMDDQSLDFTEFKEFILHFLPAASDEQLQTMFENIDTDSSSTITKKQLFDSAFFTEFIRTSDRLFSMREHELSNQSQSEMIFQLQDYVSSVGRPAEFENQRLKQEIRNLKDEKRYVERQNAAFRLEISACHEAEKRYQTEIQNLRQSYEDQVQELIELQDHMTANAESTNEAAFLQKELDAERARCQELSGKLRKLKEISRASEANLRQVNLENKKLTLDVERLEEKTDWLTEELAQWSDQYKIERVRADTLAETVVSLQHNLEDQDDYIQERDRQILTPARTMRINSDGFVLDGMMSDAGSVSDDLFSQIIGDDTIMLSRPVALFEATPEPEASPRPDFQDVMKRARKLAHKRSNSAVSLPLVTPRNRRRSQVQLSPNLLSVPAVPNELGLPDISSKMRSDDIIRNTVEREMKFIREKLNECVRQPGSELELARNQNEQLLAAMAELQEEVASLKQDVNAVTRAPLVEQEPQWASKLKRDVAGETSRSVEKLLKESKSPPRQGCCVWPWSGASGSEYARLGGS